MFWAVAVHSAGPFEKFQKTLILAFEANSATAQNTFFDIFKSAKTQYGEKSETKIMKITHSASIRAGEIG